MLPVLEYIASCYIADNGKVTGIPKILQEFYIVHNANSYCRKQLL